MRLRWRTLIGALRSAGTQRWTVIAGIVASVFVGISGAIGLAVAGQNASQVDAFFVIAPTTIALFVVAVGVIAGVSQPIDPRVLATEPLTDRQLATGLLVGSAVGPPGLSGALLAVGLFVGAWRGIAAAPIAAMAAVSFAVTLLFVSRSAINALGLFVTRFPRAGQILVGVVSLVFYGGFQFLPHLAGGLDANGQRELADVLQFTPPGQLGRALSTSDSDPVVAIVHLVAGAIWLIPLALLYVWTTHRLIVSVKHIDAMGATETVAQDKRRRHPVRVLARRLCGTGPIGAVAWRSILTRFRTPRTALETFTGAGVGMALVLVPALIRDDVGAGAVLVGGAVQLAILFMAGNSFGSDGPALSNELLCGVDPAVLIRAKARSIAIVAAPLPIIGPLVATSITGEWEFIGAGFLIGFGALLAGTGGAIVQSTLVPIAIPEGDNPLASGDSGKGCLAGIILAAVVLSLALVTLPVALALFWAVNRGSALLVTLFAATTVGVGWAVFNFAIHFAAKQWRHKEPEIYDAVVPAL